MPLLLDLIGGMLLGLLDFIILNGWHFVAGLVMVRVLKLPRSLRNKLRRQRWISNIPGNATQGSRLFTSYVGPYPELNDFNSILLDVPLDGPVVLRGTPPPTVRYWSLQAFLAGVPSHKAEQTLRDTQITLDQEGKFTVVMSKDRPSWAINWLPIPRDSSKCVLCLRAYRPNPGIAFMAPKVFYLPLAADGTPQQYPSEAAALSAVPPEPIDWEQRVNGMWASCCDTTGHGSQHIRLRLVGLLNLAVLVLLPSKVHAVVFGALMCKLLAQLAERPAIRQYKNLVGGLGLVPNVSVHVPNPKGELMGHPRHLYYTLQYDARESDVRIKGWLRGKFTYTSVHAYGHDSIPVPNFLYDESLVSDADASSGGSTSSSSMFGSSSADKDRYTLFLTTKPSYEPKVNEIDVSSQPVGVVLIRLIYPEDAEIARCKPSMAPVAVGDRGLC